MADNIGNNAAEGEEIMSPKGKKILLGHDVYGKLDEKMESEINSHTKIDDYTETFFKIISSEITRKATHELAHKQVDELLFGPDQPVITQVGTPPIKGGGPDDSTHLIIKKIIANLQSDEIKQRINIASAGEENKKKQMMDRLSIVTDTLKKQVSNNYFDYEIDNIFDIFFPKAPSADDLKLNKAPDQIIETNGKIKTFMYSYPVDQETLDKKGDKSKQENNPFGIQMSVFRKDPKNMDLSEILGIEMWLAILNMSGANTNYIQEYYFGKDNKPNPMHVNEINIKERKKNPFLK